VSEQVAPHYVAIIGGGPAGLFAARELAERHIHSVIFNRDIKPGGLAEYGIYPTKLKMKEGLRGQFRQILARPEIEYYGNVLVGDQGDISMDDLRAMGFDALLVTVGAQSTKRLGIGGEDLTGVYHAKDIVYHYNLLPPYSENTYSIGLRVAVIGVGNVMVDVAHWLIDEKGVEKVIAIARRGPADVKFDRKELEEVISCLDIGNLVDELDRVAPVVLEIGQDPAALLNVVREVALKMPDEVCHSNLSLRFLSTPVGILGDENGRVKGLQVEENRLVLTEDGLSRPVGTGNLTTLDVDTVIFAIGDVVDAGMGLPVLYGEFAKNPHPRFPVDGVSYELFDQKKNEPIPDVFLAGWARKPSVGLVGIARKDATNSIQAVSRYLETIPAITLAVSAQVQEKMLHIGKPVIDKQALQRLVALEKDRAKDLGVATFKFASNEEMLQVLDLV
jgi:ferredoxin/flavodoxin---NADP+ reductase